MCETGCTGLFTFQASDDAKHKLYYFQHACLIILLMYIVLGLDSLLIGLGLGPESLDRQG